ncbi:unnamed protein product [Camellia sinensis]
MVMTRHSSAFVVLALTCFLCFSACTESHRTFNMKEKSALTGQAGPLVFVGVNNVFTKPQIPNHAPNGVSVSDQKTSPLPVENAGSLSVPYQIKDVQEKWCIVKPSTPAAKLDDIIQFCCIQIEVDCSAIQVGGMCYNPATNKVSDASVVMNMYYQIAGQFDHGCNFGGSGLIITQDPSVGQCIYQLGE